MTTLPNGEPYGAVLRKRVKKGVAWLDEHAPPDWRRRMFNIIWGKGRAGMRGCSSSDNKCHLALAFTEEAKYANKFGYVTFAQVLKHFTLTLKQSVEMGFHPDPADKDGALLDRAWEEALYSYAKPHDAPPRHDTAPAHQ